MSPSIQPTDSIPTSTTDEQPAADPKFVQPFFVRGDGGSITAEALEGAKWPEEEWKKQRHKLRRFYKNQNLLIDSLVSDDADTRAILPSINKQISGEMRTAPEDGADGAGKVSTRLPAAVRLALNGSFVLNVALVCVKVVAAVASGSMSVVASAADSLLDLISGLVLFLAQRAVEKFDIYKYPEGRARIEPLGVVIFAAVMGMSSLQIIVESVKRAVSIAADGPQLELSPGTIAILVGTIVSKLGASLVCRAVAARHKSVACEAYAQDHRNDVLTNLVGVIAVILAGFFPSALAQVDPLGAIAIAVWIIYSWMKTALEVMAKLAGLVAPAEFMRRLTHLVYNHDARIHAIDTVRAYHFGERFLVEVDIVLPEAMPLREAHDIGQVLQDRIEALDEVERAFVHLDWEWQHKPEHVKYARRLPPAEARET